MANAIRKISVARGYDARSYVLNCFGGAGGQHACLVADALGMKTVFIHPLSGLLSAYGMKLAALRAVRQRFVGAPLCDALPELEIAVDELRGQAEDELKAQGAAAITATARVHIRYDGSDTTLPIALSSLAKMSQTFARDHARQFGFGFEGRALIAESVEAEAQSGFPSRARGGVIRVGGRSRETPQKRDHRPPRTAAPHASREKHKVLLARRMARRARAADADPSRVIGPALIVEPHQTIVVEPGWRAEQNEHGIILTRIAERGAVEREGRSRSGPARSICQPVHGDRRGDGRGLQNTATR